jgi:hypothetical protein
MTKLLPRLDQTRRLKKQLSSACHEAWIIQEEQYALDAKTTRCG